MPPVLSDLDIAYAAGLFDGEGWIAISKARYQKRGKIYTGQWLVVGVSSTDPRIFLWLKDRFAGSIHMYGTSKGHLRPHGVWKTTSTNAARFLALVRPYLILKDQQADIGLAFQALKGKAWERITNLAERDALMEQLDRLHFKGPRRRHPTSGTWRLGIAK